MNAFCYRKAVRQNKNVSPDGSLYENPNCTWSENNGCSKTKCFRPWSGGLLAFWGFNLSSIHEYLFISKYNHKPKKHYRLAVAMDLLKAKPLKCLIG